MFVTIGNGHLEQDKRFLHIDGQHFIYLSRSGLGKEIVAVELFRYAQLPRRDPNNSDIWITHPHAKESLVQCRYVKMDLVKTTYVPEIEEERVIFFAKRAIKKAVKDKVAAFVDPDPNVRLFAQTLRELDDAAKLDNDNMKYV